MPVRRGAHRGTARGEPRPASAPIPAPHSPGGHGQSNSPSAPNLAACAHLRGAQSPDSLKPFRLFRRLASGILEKLPGGFHGVDKRAKKLCARFDMTLRVGILDLREFQTGELDFVLRLLDGILFGSGSVGAVALRSRVPWRTSRLTKSPVRPTRPVRLSSVPVPYLSDYSYFESSRRRSFARWVACHS